VRKRRTEFEIIKEILEVARFGAKKTEIVYKTNLTFTRVNRYLKYLLEKGLIKKEDDYWKTTEKGLEFIVNFHRLTRHI